MCLGAIYWARLDSLYYASTRFDAAKAGFDDEFIYEEFKKPLENRKISTIQINHPDHFLPFKEWIELEQKTEY
jgi:tRNA(Arg) A34 adenosine deaminase TadA